MPLTVSSRRLPEEQRGGEDAQGRRTYTEVFEVDQTDGGPLAAGVAVVIAAQSVMTGDPVPLRGDLYSYAGTTDLDAYAQGFSWRRPHPVTMPKRWHVTVEYGPVEGDPGTLSEADPLLWPVIYWKEVIEEQVPIERARIVEDLSHVGRAPDSLGPIVNACGQQQIDPQLKTIRYPVLCCQKNYATLDEIIALDAAFEETTNDDVFFGSPARTARYLGTDTGPPQQIQGTLFYTGVTRIWFRSATWDRAVLNNGMMHFRKDGEEYILENDKPKLFRHMIREALFTEDGSQLQGEFTPSPEPANLALDGTALPTDQAGINLHYRFLAEVDYTGIGIGG